MTYTVKTRGAGGYLLAEYRCAHEGCGAGGDGTFMGSDVFEVLVQRDENGDAPDTQPCPDCARPGQWTVSAAKMRVLSVPAYAAVRGGDMSKEERKERGILDQRPLAEGKVTLTEWKKEQREETKRRRHAQLIDKGVIQRKVQV